MIKNKKIAFFGCKHTTQESMQYFLDNIGKIDFLITISEKLSSNAKVAGFSNLIEFAKKNKIEVYVAKSYSLLKDQDLIWFQENKIDVCFVMGWQRLIPDRILSLINIGVFGMHGSADNLPRGRGRSPMNWALIMGRKYFYTNLFKYDKSIDSGGILDEIKFEIHQDDTIETMHYKNTISMCELIYTHIDSILENSFLLNKQEEEKATYFPKREPQDGFIDWSLKSKHIYNFVRALTKPFPGAFTYLNNDRLDIWEVRWFALGEKYRKFKPGEIVQVFSNGKFCVKTGDNVILINQYDFRDKELIKKGHILKSEPYHLIYKDIEKRYPSFVNKDYQKEITYKKIQKLYD